MKILHQKVLRRIRNAIKHDEFRKKFAILGFAGVAWAVLWAIGVTDFFYERDFSEFQWPPYVNVRDEVYREILGEPASVLYYNDWSKHKPVLTPNCTANRLTRRKSLLIIVKTAPYRLANRDAIRSTWGRYNQVQKFRVRTVFVMGQLSAKEEDSYGDVLAAEQKQFGDLLVGNFVDAYRNNTLKLLQSLQFAHNHCKTGPVSYVLLVDDDYMVNLNNLVAEAEKHPPNERLYMGFRIDSSPFRLIFSKHRVSLRDYPYAVYPPYITAGAVFLTSQTVTEFYYAVQHMKIFPFDDIYASILAYSLGIWPQNHDGFVMWNEDPEDMNLNTIIASHGFSPKDLLKYGPIVNRNVGLGGEVAGTDVVVEISE
uniref:Hexosyltransferase n=1 Tax=Panagrellus redivivus TaxID=6233 RepID=A0A7E4V276_PANRE